MFIGKRSFKICFLLYAACVLFLLENALAQSAEHEEQLQSSGYPCTGYDPVRQVWGWQGTYQRPTIKCPKDYAFFGIAQPWGEAHKNRVIIGNCCRLPSSDILSNEHIVTYGECPDGFVVTGVMIEQKSKGNASSSSQGNIRCSKINDARYSLGPLRGGIHWGISNSSAYPWQEKKRIRRNQIPLAIRYGVARESLSRIQYTGCVGSPIGSLFVGARTRNCKDTLWREVYEIDPQAGKQKIQMFPKCKKLDSLFSPTPRCVE